MLKLLVVLAVVGSLSAQAVVNAPECGRRPLKPDGERIVGGKVATPGDWGWQVSLTSGGRHFCGGVLITNKHVLSAAHCFANGVIPRLAGVVLGVHKRSDPEKWIVKRGIAKLWRHENYNGNLIQNDISILELDQEVEFNDYIVPACVDLNKEIDIANKVAELTGWGAPFSGGSTTDLLYETTMNMFSDEFCKQKYSSMYNVNYSICGGELEANNGACQGDSGGPLVYKKPADNKYYVMGLTSWGYGCGAGTVYARVNHYIDWLLPKINGSQ